MSADQLKGKRQRFGTMHLSNRSNTR